MIMAEVKIIKGEVFSDNRGSINSLNNFTYDGVRRSYFITHPDTETVRGWNAHWKERKWFCCLKGEFKLALVKLDSWDNPSEGLSPEVYTLNSSEMQLVAVPGGYASAMQATVPDSVLMVLSDTPFPPESEDSQKFPLTLWSEWLKK